MPGSATVSLSRTGLCGKAAPGPLFLAEHSDLGEWMARPTMSRLADLRRTKAWPLLSWAALSGLVRLDLDLLAAKDLGE